MVIHKNTRLTPFQRKAICKSYHEDKKKVSELADEYHVSRPTIYKILRNGRHKDFTIHKSINQRFRCLEYGIKRLAKVEGNSRPSANAKPNATTRTTRGRCSMATRSACPC